MKYHAYTAGYEESILHSQDDFEPYGFSEPRLQSAVPATGEQSVDPFEPIIGGAVLRGLRD